MKRTNKEEKELTHFQQKKSEKHKPNDSQDRTT